MLLIKLYYWWSDFFFLIIIIETVWKWFKTPSTGYNATENCRLNANTERPLVSASLIIKKWRKECSHPVNMGGLPTSAPPRPRVWVGENLCWWRLTEERHGTHIHAPPSPPLSTPHAHFLVFFVKDYAVGGARHIKHLKCLYFAYWPLMNGFLQNCIWPATIELLHLYK